MNPLVDDSAQRRVDDPVLTVKEVFAGYGGDHILRGISLAVGRGEIVTVLGPNGSGKSTLLKTIVGLVPASRGEVVFVDGQANEHRLTGLPAHRIIDLGLGYVPQVSNVFADMSVRENLEIGAFASHGSTGSALERVIELFPILRERLPQRAGTLSGGQRQMVALARAMMAGPEMLVLDEPSVGLAPIVVDEVFAQVRTVHEAGITVLIVEQKARQCLALSDYGYVLDMGQNRYQGSGERLLHDDEVADLYLGGRGRLAAARKAREEGR